MGQNPKVFRCKQSIIFLTDLLQVQFLRIAVINLLSSMSKLNCRQKWTLWDYAKSWSFIGAFTTLNNPFELVRFRMQVMPLLVEQGHLNALYKGCVNCAMRIYRNEGVKSFLKGNFSNLIRVVSSENLVWWLKEYLQRSFHYSQNLTDAQHLKYNTMIGVSASMAVSLSLYPLEYFRQLLLNRTDKKGRSLGHYLKKTVMNEGISGIYKGALIYTLGLILFRGTYFGIYDTLKVKTSNEIYRWMTSALAAYMSILASYPVDTVRRRFVSCKGKYPNTRTCFLDILGREGVRGLFLGWPMITVQSLNLSLVFYFYDRLITDYSKAVN